MCLYAFKLAFQFGLFKCVAKLNITLILHNHGQWKFLHAYNDIKHINKEPQLSLAVIMIFQMLTSEV